MTGNDACPCGSGRNFADCCGPLLAERAAAPTAEHLMRSRYTAYTRGDRDYLLATWHPSTRPAQLALDEQPVWTRLEVLACAQGDDAESDGWVEFAAHFRTATGAGRLHERSRFRREQGRWYYVDGFQPDAAAPRVGRNAPCPCGSGRKFKRCCGR